MAINGRSANANAACDVLLAGGAAAVFCGVFRDAGLLALITGVWLNFAAPQALERLDVWSLEILPLWF